MEVPYIHIPPEIVGIIAHQLNSTGICDSWKLRGVSRTFRDAITDDIVMRQTKDVLEEKKHIIEHLMPRYLFCRIQKPLDVHDPFLVRLTKMNEYLCCELGISDPTKKADNLFALCQGFSNDAIQDWLRRYNASPICIEAKLAAAMSICALPLLSALLPQLTEHDEVYHHGNACFEGGSLLLAAVSMENDEMLHLLLDHDLPTKLSNHSKDHLFDRALRLATRQSSATRTLTLFDAYQTAESGSHKSRYNSALERAVNETSGETNIDIVAGLLDRCPGGQKIHPQVFTKACIYASVDVVKLLLEHMAINDATSHLTLPLNRAIRSGRAEMVDAVLEAGADINNTNYGSLTDCRGLATPELSPMEIAIKTGEIAVKMLLERGAIVPSLSTWYRCGSSIFNVLREAKMARTGQKLRTWEQNRLIVRREDQEARKGREASRV